MIQEFAPQHGRWLGWACAALIALLCTVSTAAQPAEDNTSAESSTTIALEPTADATEAAASASPFQVIEDAEAPTLFLKAAEAYNAGRYQEAGKIYRQLIAAGFDSGDLRYDLANTLLRTGELGRAIAEFRRSQVLSPRDQDVRANLAFARKSTKDAVLPPQAPAWSKTLFFWHYTMNGAETFKLLVLVGMLFWGAIALMLIRLAWRSRWAIGLLLLVMIALAGSLAIRWRFPQRVAVVLPAQTNAYSGTDLQSRVILNLHAGTELAVTASDSDWTQFEMPAGVRGWLPTEDLEIVDPRKLGRWEELNQSDRGMSSD